MQLEWVNIIIGVLMPLALAVANRHGWDADTKAGFGLVLSFLVAVLATLVQGGPLSIDGIGQALVTVWGTAIVTYKGFWQPTGIAPAIEEATG